MEHSKTKGPINSGYNEDLGFCHKLVLSKLPHFEWQRLSFQIFTIWSYFVLSGVAMISAPFSVP